jgi:hypothetical protein
LPSATSAASRKRLNSRANRQPDLASPFTHYTNPTDVSRSPSIRRAASAIALAGAVYFAWRRYARHTR